MSKRTHTPYLQPHYQLSKCCESKCLIVPPCFGDAEIIICRKCNKHTEIILKPVYEQVSKGVYREIKYWNIS